MIRMLRQHESCQDTARWIVLAVAFGWIGTFIALPAYAMQEDLEPDPTEVIDREPFDRIVLDADNDNFVLEVLPLDFPGGQVPANPGGTEMLQFRLVTRPSLLYEVRWRNIARIDLYPIMIRDRARELVEQGEIDEAFKYLDWLLKNSPGTPGLAITVNDYLSDDADKMFAERRYSENLVALEALKLRNAAYRDDNGRTVDQRIRETLSILLDDYIKNDQLGAAASLIEHVRSVHGQSQEAVTGKLDLEIRRRAEGHRDNAKRHLLAGEGREAHAEVRRMRNIMSDLPDATELIRDIYDRFPMVLIGVSQPAIEYDPVSLDNWAARRVGRLVNRTLLEFIGQGGEGGEYLFPHGRIEMSEDLLAMSIMLNQANLKPGLPDIDAYRFSKRLLSRADHNSPEYHPAWEQMLRSVAINDETRIEVEFRRGYAKPESLLQIGYDARPTADGEPPFDALYAPEDRGETDVAKEQIFRLNDRYEIDVTQRHPVIVEVDFDDASDATRALLQGDIDLLDDVFPGDISRLKRERAVTVAPYALPTMHILVPNLRNEVMRNPSFRRGLLYGINRYEILNQALCGGSVPPGFEVISGPFPIGQDDSDPISYASDPRIAPVAYEPRLAATLLALGEGQVKEMAEKLGQEAPVRPTLVLAYPANDVAGVACQFIAQQLKLIQVDVELRQLPPGVTRPEDDKYDLLYVEITMQEPLIDARTLLGDAGIANLDSPAIDMALRRLDATQSWPEAVRRLRELHILVHSETAVLPLWQTVKHFGYRKNLRGVGTDLPSLYEGVANWQVVAEVSP